MDGGGGRGVLVEDIKGVTRAWRGRWVPTRGSDGSVCLCLTKPVSPADCAPEHVSPRSHQPARLIERSRAGH